MNTSIDSANSRNLIIFGAGGHGVSVASVAISAGYKIAYFIDKKKQGSNLFGIDVLGDLDKLGDLEKFDFAIGVGDNFLRQRIHSDLKNYHSLNFPTLIHRSAIISSFASIEEGTVVMPNGVIGPNSKVGRFCLINTHASIDHDSMMLDFSSLGPSAVTGGNVKVGECSSISISATIMNGITVGDNCVVGASSYLNQNLASNHVAFGVPAKNIRLNKTKY